MPYEPNGLESPVLFCPFHLMSLYKCENGAVQSADFCAKQPKKFSPVIGCFAQHVYSFFTVGCHDYCAVSDSLTLLFIVFSCVFFMTRSHIVVN